MITSLFLTCLALFALKVVTKNAERRAAEKIALLLARADEEELVQMLREMVPEPDALYLAFREFGANLLILGRPLVWCYNILNFSTVHVDARTASVPVLFESEEELMDLRDFDVLDVYGLWKDALRRDMFTLVALLFALLGLFTSVLSQLHG